MRIFLLTALLIPLNANATCTIESGFSPNGTAKHLVMRTIDEARTSLEVAIYQLTDRDIIDALDMAEARGIKLNVLVDKSQKKHPYPFPVKQDVLHKIMHDKFIIADNETVQTGSYNYSHSANNRNAENVIVMQHCDEIAKQYREEFNKLWTMGVER